MNWLPYENYYILSPLSPDEVRSRLQQHVSPFLKRGIMDAFINKHDTCYKGFINKEGFKIQPVVVGRNSFIPLIRGSVTLTEWGSRVHIKMTLLDFVQFFVFVVLIFLLIASIAMVSHWIASKEFELVFLAPVGMMVFIYVMMIFSFMAESRSSKLFLLALFEGQYE